MSVISLGNAITAVFRTYSGGTLTDADSTPTGTLRRNAADSGQTVTVTNLSTGVYKAVATPLAAWDNGDWIALEVSATVGGVTDVATLVEGVGVTLITEPVTVAVSGAAAVSVSSVRVNSALTAYNGETRSIQVTVTDTNDAAVDLTGKTMRFIAHKRPTTTSAQADAFFHVDSTSISGTGNNIVTFSLTSTELTGGLNGFWHVRDTATNLVYGDPGEFTLKNLPTTSA